MVIALYRYLLFQLEKKGGGPNFSKGDRFFQKILVPPDLLFGPGGLFLTYMHYQMKKLQ